MYRARYLMGLGPGEDSFDFVDFEATYRRKATKTYDLRRLRAQLRWKYLQMHPYAAVTASNFDDLGSGGAEMDTSQIVLLVVGTIISVFVVVLIVRLAKRELKKMIDADAPEKKEEEMREYSPEAGKKRDPGFEEDLE